jgi:hypothetical protein
MAVKKISELTAATNPTGTEVAAVVQGGITKKMTLNQLAKAQQKTFGSKYVIQFGNTPSDSSLSTNVKLLEQWELDGYVVVPTYTDPVYGATINAGWRIASSYPLKWNLFSTALSNLANAYSSKLGHNFLRVNTCTAGDSGVGNPGDRFDIFDWNSVKVYLNNIKLMARLAKQGGLRGIMLDTERYNSSGLFDFAKARSTKTFAQYQARMYSFAKEVMNEIQTEFHNVSLITTLGYEQMSNGSTDLSLNVYGLLPRFLDGLHDACADGNVVINGCEASYFNAGAGTDADMIAYYKAWQEDATNMSNLGRVLGSNRYFQTHETGFSIWLDADSDNGHPTFDYASPWTNNFWTPSTFQTAMETRFANTERYVWIYNRTAVGLPKWNGYTPGVDKVPYQYGVDALRSARVTAGIDVGYDPKLFGTKGCCRWLWDPSTAGLANNNVPQTLTNQNGTSDNFAQATSGKRATYKTNVSGTLGALLFDDTQSQCYSSSAIGGYFNLTDAPFTFVCGVQVTSLTPAAVQTLISLGHSSTANASIALRASTSPRWVGQRIDDSGSSTNFNGEQFNSGRLGTSFNIVVIRSTGTIAEISVNTVVSVAAGAQDKGTTSINTAYIGAQYVGGVESLFMKHYLVPYAMFSEFIEDGQVWAMVRHLSKLANIETI